jgi:hypothetical protein
MLLLRLVGILALVSVGVALVLYLLSRDRCYLRFAWRVLLGSLSFALLLVVFYAAERFLLVV